MAAHTINVQTTTEIPYIIVTPTSITAQPGDTVSVYNASGSTHSVSWSAFDAGKWTNTSTVTVAIGGVQNKTVAAGTTSGSDVLNISSYIAGSSRVKTLTVNFSSGVDDTLNSIDGQLGSNVTGYATSSVWTSTSSATVSGISGTTATASLSGTMSSKQLQVNGGSWVTSATVSNGDTIKVRGTTGAANSTGYTIALTLTAGNSVSDTVTVTTIAASSGGGSNLLPFDHATGPIPMSDIRQFFAGAGITGIYTAPGDIGSYYRGGTHVPNITENAAIPTSGTISFSNFRNAYSRLYYVASPSTKSGAKNTISSGGQVVVVWYIFDFNAPADWEMGYGPYMKYACEYQYSLTVTSFVVNAGGYTVYPRLTSATPTTWTAAAPNGSAGQVGFAVEMFVNQNSEIWAQGYVTQQVRHPSSPSLTLSTNVNWTLNAFGP